MLPCTQRLADLSYKPKGVILSGSPYSVYAPDAPHVDPAVFDLEVSPYMLHHRIRRGKTKEHPRFLCWVSATACKRLRGTMGKMSQQAIRRNTGMQYCRLQSTQPAPLTLTHSSRGWVRRWRYNDCIYPPLYYTQHPNRLG